MAADIGGRKAKTGMRPQRSGRAERNKIETVADGSAQSVARSHIGLRIVGCRAHRFNTGNAQNPAIVQSQFEPLVDRSHGHPLIPGDRTQLLRLGGRHRG